MSLSEIRNAGWKVNTDPARFRTVSLALLVISSLALIAAIVLDPVACSDFLNRLSAIHVALTGALTVAAVYIGVMMVSGAAGALLAVADMLPGLALTGAMMAPLPMAQIDEKPIAAPAQASGKSVARSEMQVGLYMGRSSSPRSDVFFKAPGGTDLTLTNVKWKSESFKPSPFYGGRGIDWNAHAPQFGVMVDFTHAKATAIRSQIVTHHGKHKGEDLPPSGPFANIFRKLEFTHGLNFLTLNGIFRATGLHRRAVPYVGLGIGFMVPHANVRLAGQAKEDEVHGAQITGVAMQVFGGVEWRIFKSDRKSVFTEYKLTKTTNSVMLKDGGTVDADILVHQINFGGLYTPWRVGDAAAR